MRSLIFRSVVLAHCCLTIPLLGACGDDGPDPGVDAAAEDAASAAEDSATPTCSEVAGTYDMTWVAAATNAATCSSPMDEVQFDADGFDMATPANVCTLTGCTAANCSRVPLDAACMASGSLSGPCAGLAEGRTISASSAFSGSDVTVTASDTTADGVCSFTGTGRRR